MLLLALFLGIPLIFLLLLASSSVYLVRQSEAIVLERLGKFSTVLMPGLHWAIPFVDRPREVIWTFFRESDNRRYYRYAVSMYRIDLRESVYDFPKQSVITKDNVTMEISALLYYQVTNPHAAIYEIANLPEAIEKLTHSTLRNVIGSMDLDESLVSRDQINSRLRMILDVATAKWGVNVNRVELQDVNPPENIRTAMEQQMRAERDRRAAILEAEGAKQSAILRAEGDRDANMIRAEGEAEARLRLAEAERQALVLVQGALMHDEQNRTAQYLLTTQYIKTLPQITEGKETKLVIVPYEASSLAASIASMKKILE